MQKTLIYSLKKSFPAFLSGAVMVLALPPIPLWPAMFIGFSAFYLLWANAENAGKAAWYSWLFGLGYFIFGLYWIGNALLVEGNDYAWAWPLAVFALPALLALFPAIAGYLSFKLTSPDKIGGFFMFVAAFTAAEWLRGHMFTGFPWNLYGYGWHSVLPISQLVSLGGIYWLTLLTILWAALPGFLIKWDAPQSRKTLLLLGGLMTILAAYGWGAFRLAQLPAERHDDIIIRLVQPNIAQKDKWNPAKTHENLKETLLLSKPEKDNLYIKTMIIWPETAVSYSLMRDQRVVDMIRRLTGLYPQSVYIATGHLKYRDNAYHNSLTVFDRQLEEISSYDKSHLVPFGEYIPLQNMIPLETVTKFQGFTRGGGAKHINIMNLGSFSPLVCYEIIFPGKVVNRNEPRPDWIINVTNDAWYGNSSGPYQHFTKARFRAIEEGIPVIRSANTGISGMIGPAGNILYKEKLSTRNHVDIHPPRKTETKTIYGQFPSVLFLLTLIVVTLTSAIFTKRL